ncbi:hypothetical protein AM1BK_32300 [Neobacillus kokaensis]|uniref:Uncharacterized protein n=1 Tax=Neobacillus kokaensis TaxID=2759023 RepID=A0ABQ3N850_9BACI|nr:hypothetical protein AM1BK_32300 [Neobacillus kokaensis]
MSQVPMGLWTLSWDGGEANSSRIILMIQLYLISLPDRGEIVYQSHLVVHTNEKHRNKKVPILV